MKAVSLILQFAMFFMIGFAFFLMAGNLFRFQSGIIREDIINVSSELQLSKLSALSIKVVNSCKFCDSVSVKLSPQSIGGYYSIYQFQAEEGVSLEIEPADKFLESTMHNLNFSLTYDTTPKSSVKTISLTYDRTNNKLVMK